MNAVDNARGSRRERRTGRRKHLPTRVRKFVLAVHVISSVAWIGISAGMVVLSVLGLSFTEPGMIKATYEALKVFDLTIMTAASALSLVSGVVLAWFTPWGLFRHWWIVAKLGLTVAVLILAFTVTHPAVLSALETAYAHTGAGRLDIAADGVSLAATAPVLCALLTTAAGLSFAKPWGKVRPRPQEPVRTTATEPDRPVVVHSVRKLARDVVTLKLRDPNGTALPTWTPGAHIDLVLDSGKVRQYSLHGDPADAHTYDVAVLREAGGRGGSREIHELRPGQTIAIRGPRNNFLLAQAPTYLFVAGGIGITPLIPMIEAVESQGRPWRLFYRGRSARDMAFGDELHRRHHGKVVLLPSDTAPRPDLDELVTNAPRGCAVYCCGPEPLLNALSEAVARNGEHVTLHLERFAGSGRGKDAVNEPFEVRLQRSGKALRVEAEETMLDAIRKVTSGPPSSCQDGVCGSCELTVLHGVPDHRDDVLPPEEQDRTDVIYPCVSRAKSEVLVVDS